MSLPSDILPPLKIVGFLGDLVIRERFNVAASREGIPFA
jgi:hypothetical protein